MKIVPVQYYCEGCQQLGTTKNNIRHKENCPVIADKIWEKKKELLSEWLRLELPKESMEVYNWKGTKFIAHNLLLYMKDSPLFNTAWQKEVSLEEI